MSDNIANYVYGNDVTPGEWQRLQITVKRAHDLKLPVRFWATPDNMEVWSKLMQLQVDYINTDHIDALNAFLNTVYQWLQIILVQRAM